MDRRAIISDILRSALGSNENQPVPAAEPEQPATRPQIVIHAQTVIVVEGSLLLCDSGLKAAEELIARRPRLFGQALRSADENRRRLERLGPPRF